MLDILAWTVFGVVLTVMVAISVICVWFSEDPSFSETEGKLLKSKGGENNVGK